MSHEVPREEIPWFPTIDTDLCASCQDCFDFCVNDVYGWDDQWGFPIVVNPYNCVVGCQACGKLCATEAITFPDRDEINALVQRLREAHAAAEVLQETIDEHRIGRSAQQSHLRRRGRVPE